MLVLLSLLSVLVWLALLFARDGFWRADQQLPPSSPEEAQGPWPAVTAIVPARNEEAVIAESLAFLLDQDYPGPLQVLVVDDSSEDATAERARAVFAVRQNENRTGGVLTAPPLPSGWAGKLWALNTAEQQLRESDAPAYVWLTDADIRHGPDTLRRLVTKARAGHLALVSQMVRLRLDSFWERHLVPAFVFFFQKLYPFQAVNAPDRNVAAAAGGCILLDWDALMRIGGIAALKDALIDDCTLARLVKESGGALWLGLTNDSISLRPYPDLASFWAMVARSAYTQLNHSPAMLLVTLFSMTLTYLVPPLLLLSWPLHGNTGAGLLALLACVMMAAAYWPTLRFYGFSLWEALWLPFAALLYTVMTLDSARLHWLGRGGAWKGRHYGESGQTALEADS